MKTCRTVNGLVKALKKGEDATLNVWGTMPNGHDSEGAYLNLGEGRYSYVGKENWNLIKNHITKKSKSSCDYCVN